MAEIVSLVEGIAPAAGVLLGWRPGSGSLTGSGSRAAGLAVPLEVEEHSHAGMANRYAGPDLLDPADHLPVHR
jgi:hypothetical protein